MLTRISAIVAVLVTLTGCRSDPHPDLMTCEAWGLMETVPTDYQGCKLSDGSVLGNATYLCSDGTRLLVIEGYAYGVTGQPVQPWPDRGTADPNLVAAVHRCTP